ncbi:DNase1 protein [Stachybotrys elegans]|uniref:DNase1 protein n=1 Tax=Stachybotrys elegans TaxID=80388 RepID=A0A8K0SM74_9HYPO|nr:DNase1 protein [Stachybotrys elegans]
MKFSTSAMALVASAAASRAASVTFWTLDNVERTLYFTPNPESSAIEPVTVNNQQNSTVQFPDTWVGNWYAVQSGANNVPGMLGEVQFGGWNGLTYFDVSAIVDPNDHDNVKQMWPAVAQTPMSGCEVFPCNNVYWLPDDVQTKTTTETDLWTTLGSGSTGMAFA